MDEKTALTYSIVRALAYQENGGKPDLNNLQAGKSGELKSIFQFTPDTWKKDAGNFLGDPNADLTPDNETQVMVKQVGDWIDKGYNVKQMASMHNAGIGEPDAYTGQFSTGKASVGVNEHGVKYNVPAYADSVAQKATEFYKNDLSQQQGQPIAAPAATTMTQSSAQSPVQSNNSTPASGAMGKLMFAKLGAPSAF